MNNIILNDFKTQSLLRFNENCLRIEEALEHLTDTEIWYRPNTNSNSIGNLILHLNGNIRQYMISGLGGEEDHRDRPSEFEASGGTTKEKLTALLSETCKSSMKILKELQLSDLTDIKNVQGFRLSGIGIIIHVVEHFSYHTGQIAYITKQLKDIDLGYYSGFDLNVKNIPEDE